MTEERTSVRAWRWHGSTPIARFHGPVEMYWRGLDYSAQWDGDVLSGERELDGQRRQFTVALGAPEPEVVEIRCRLTFAATSAPPRAGEIYDPAELVTGLGRAIARGFGMPAAES
jgi:hypothetical protein